MANRVISKVLAGIEDLLLGTGVVNQTRAGVTKSITKIDAAGLIYENAETLRTRFGKKVEVLNNIAEMQALTTTTAIETFIYLLGYTTAGDGGGGLFWLDSTDTTTVEDLNIVFNPDILANGRWKRVDTDNYMSPDHGDAHYTVKAFDFGIHLYDTTLTADRTVGLPTTGLYKGKRLAVLRLAGGSFNLLIGAITTLASPGLAELSYDGISWIVLSNSTVSTDAVDIVIADTDSLYTGTDVEAALQERFPTLLGTIPSGPFGTTINLTAVPAWAKKVTLSLSGLSSTGTSPYILQLNTEITGYKSSAAELKAATAVAVTNSTIGFVLTGALTTAASVVSGNITLSLIDTVNDLWLISGNLVDSNGNVIFSIAGEKQLTASPLTGIRLNTVGGVDTFDNGVMNVIFEG